MGAIREFWAVGASKFDKKRRQRDRKTEENGVAVLLRGARAAKSSAGQDA